MNMHIMEVKGIYNLMTKFSIVYLQKNIMVIVHCWSQLIH